MDWRPLAFDTTLQTPLQNTFFASVGFGASVLLLKRGGPLVLIMMIVASLAAALQNVLGAGVAYVLGEHPLMGVLAGSVTLTGGPATGLAFAPLFEEAGVPGAATLAVSAAWSASSPAVLLGGPIGTYLLDRHPRRVPAPPSRLARSRISPSSSFPEPAPSTPAGEDVEAYALLKHLVVIITAVGAGVWVSAGLQSLGWTLPAYIGAMIVAAIIRNIDDATGIIGMSQRTIDDLGTVALALFLVMALMTLRLWELAGVVIPLLVILFCQVLFVAAICRAGDPAADGEGLRRGGDVERLLRVHARDDGERRRQHGSAGRAVRAGAEGLPRRTRSSVRSESISSTAC